MSKNQDQYMSTVKVGKKGQIVIPKEIRGMFDIESEDTLVIMADLKRGIAIQKASILNTIADAIFDGRGQEVMPYEKDEELEAYAKEIKKSISAEDKSTND